MKKILFMVLMIALSMSIYAQNTKRAMRVFYNGEIVRSLDATKVDSINLHFADVDKDNLNDGDESEITDQLYVGVVAFNQRVFLKPITSDVTAVKNFINEQTNDKDQTSIAYAASRGNHMFDASDLPKFDKVYMLNFTDGFDNFSSRLWRDSIGRVVNKDYVYDTARYDLLQHAGLNSYALAFGEEAIKVEEQTKKLVLGTGKYYEAATASELQPTFNEIAESMLASAQNAVLQTNAEYYFASAPKKFQLLFTSEGGFTDVVYASVTGIPSAGYTLVIDSVANNYVSFDTPAYGIEDDETHKANIPLNNMKFVKDGTELQFKYKIKIQTRDGSLYAEDVEDASSSEEIAKRIAVVLVLDCSTSMGDAFEPMKAAAINFIETMEKMEVETPDVDIPDVQVPTNEELWEDFKTYFQEYYGVTRADAPITDVASFWCSGIDSDANILTNTDSKYKWLGDYIAQVSAADGRSVDYETMWRHSLSSFFNCNKRESFPITADFTEAGKPENWGSYYLAAHSGNANMENGYEYVDLGLSVKWAICNVGASKPEEYGDYFAWGETQPKSTYDLSTYKWCNGSSATLTKYNYSSSFGTVDDKTQLELIDDAARANWGGIWRMPTDAELTELRTECTWTWTTQNGVNGYKVTSKSNGNSIFLPAAGFYSDSNFRDAGDYCCCWSSSLGNNGFPTIPIGLYFYGYVNYVNVGGYNGRFDGQSIRPVCL